ncbi:MAG: glycine betaine/L-proline ABC transporter ATP-binding protein [Rhodospirillales bacterium]
MTPAKIEIRNLSKVFGPDPRSVLPLVHDGIGKRKLLDEHRHVLALRHVDLGVAPRRVQVVMGLSGSGKSTLVRHVNGLIRPTEGAVRIDGREVAAMDRHALRELRRHAVAMVFQRFALLPHRTVLENVGYGMAIQGMGKSEWLGRAEEWIAKVGLAGFENAYPAQLSGGMEQRVGLARALSTDVEILLMDEPFSALDPLNRADMQNLLLDLQSDLKKTIVFITHDLDEALKIGDRVAILRDGEIVQDGTPQDIVLSPADAYVEDFIKDIDRGRVVRVGAIVDRRGARKTAADGPALPAHMVLAEGARRLVDRGFAEARVVGPDGDTLGTLTLAEIVAAMGKPGD